MGNTTSYQLGLKLWSINTDAYLKEAERLFKDGWFDYIELYVVPGTLDTLEYWGKLDIPFTVHAPHFAHGFNLAKPEKRDSNLASYQQVKMFADELESDYVIFHGGIDGSVEQTALQLKGFTSKLPLKSAMALMENKPFKALPNRMGGTFCRGYNPEEILLVLNEVNCGFCLDFGHAVCSANSQKLDVYEYIDELVNLRPQMFHLTDLNDVKSELDSHPHFGEGQLDIKKILQKIPSNSKITIETNKNSKTDLNDFIEDIKYIKNML